MLVLTIYTLTFSVGLPANVFTLVTLLGKARRGRVSPSDILLLNLTSADLLLLLFLPFKMAEAAAGMTWPLPAALCPVANFCFYSSIYLSSLFLAALSVERYLGVVFPLRYKARRRPARVMAASAAIWLLACSHCSIVFVAQYHGAGGGAGAPGNATGVGGDGGSAVSEVGGFKMADVLGLEPGGVNASRPGDSITVRISKRSAVDREVFDLPHPGDAVAATARISKHNAAGGEVFELAGPGDPPTNPATERISKRSVIDPNGFNVPNPGDSTTSNPRSLRISKRNVIDPNGFNVPDPGDATTRISKRNIVDHEVFNVYNPGDSTANLKVFKLSSPGDPPTRTEISKRNVVVPNGFNVPNAGDSTTSNPRSLRISKRNVVDHEVFKPSNPRDSTPTTVKISKRNVVDHEVFNPSNPVDPTANVFAPHDASTRRDSRISKPNNPKTSKPHISSPNRANTRHLPVPRPSHAAAPPPPSPYHHHHPPSSTPAQPYRCYDDFSKAQLSFVLPLRLELFLVLFLLPFAVTIFCYINFVRVLLSRPNIPLEKKQRAVGLAVATMVNYGVCFAPYNASHVVGFVEKQSPSWRVYALLLTSLNAALDPVIFYFSSTAVQRAMAGLALAARDKMAAAAGWCRGACGREEEARGSLT